MSAHAPSIVVMGVSGSGKSTFGAALARALDAPFREGDDLHPAANVAKMAAGAPLDDHDRAPWLVAVGAWLASHGETGGVVSCSALRRAYRDRLRAACPALKIIMLDADGATLRARLALRRGHFMPPSLLDSQVATLEPPGPDENALVLDATAPLGISLAQTRSWLGRP